MSNINILKNTEIEVDSNDIFKNDLLNRKESIIDLSSLIISSNQQPFTLSINANWGSGKTTFVKLWKAYLAKEHSINSLYFSAWEDDFTKEPLISILGEINKYISENFHADPEVEKKFTKVKQLSVKILKRGAPAFIKGAISGLIDIGKGYDDAIAAMAESSAIELIDNYSEEKNITEEFKNAISELLSYIDEEKPFVIFVDELDRCRPTYSIELLERIKHVFGIKGLIFVLSIDKSQLSESIKSQYGNIDTDNYLRRFIDLEYNLSSPNVEKFCDFLNEKFQLKSLLQSKQIDYDAHASMNYINLLKRMTAVLHLSLRQIEQIFTRLNIIFKTIKPRLFAYHFHIIILFEVLKTIDSKLYYEFISKKEVKEKVKQLLLNKDFEDLNIHKNLNVVFEAIIDCAFLTSEEIQVIQYNKNKELNIIMNDPRKNSEQENRLRMYIQQIGIKLGHVSDYGLNNLVDTAIKKIEFADRFNFE